MATYVISDIHGYKDRFIDVLNKTNFDWDHDVLYVLGDIIDRGPQSAEMLIWAIEEAPKNIHFLIGNHEDMALPVLKRITDFGDVEADNYDEPWFWNGGYNTLDTLRELKGSAWCRYVAATWIENLPFYYIVDDKLLIHAGLVDGIRISDDYYSRGIDKLIDIPGIEMPQWSQSLLWIRDRWLYNKNCYPYDVIFGHTPTSYNWMQEMEFLRDIVYEGDYPIACEGRPGNIVRMTGYANGKLRYCIDTGRSRMGLLRLDDYAEFYSDLKSDEDE